MILWKSCLVQHSRSMKETTTTTSTTTTTTMPTPSRHGSVSVVRMAVRIMIPRTSCRGLCSYQASSAKSTALATPTSTSAKWAYPPLRPTAQMVRAAANEHTPAQSFASVDF